MSKHDFKLTPKNYVTVYLRHFTPGIEVTIAPREPGSTVLALRVRRGDDVSLYRPSDVFPSGYSASDLVQAWIDPQLRQELAARNLEVRYFVDPEDEEIELAKRFLGQRAV